MYRIVAAKTSRQEQLIYGQGFMILLDELQLSSLSAIVRESAISATESLSIWLGRDVRVEVDPLAQIALEDATESIGPVDETVCACCMRVSGRFQGHLVFSFDDQSGLALCDALLSRATGSIEWGELEISAAICPLMMEANTASAIRDCRIV